MEDHDVTAAQQVLKVGEPHFAVGLRIQIIRQQSTSEGLQLGRRRAPDSPVADQPDRQIGDASKVGPSRVPDAGLGVPVKGRDAASPSQHKSDGVVRDLSDAIVGHIGDPCSTRRRRLHGDVVETHTDPLHDFQPARSLDGVFTDVSPACHDRLRIMKRDKSFDRA